MIFEKFNPLSTDKELVLVGPIEKLGLTPTKKHWLSGFNLEVVCDLLTSWNLITGDESVSYSEVTGESLYGSLQFRTIPYTGKKLIESGHNTGNSRKRFINPTLGALVLDVYARTIPEKTNDISYIIDSSIAKPEKPIALALKFHHAFSKLKYLTKPEFKGLEYYNLVNLLQDIKTLQQGYKTAVSISTKDHEGISLCYNEPHIQLNFETVMENKDWIVEDFERVFISLLRNKNFQSALQLHGRGERLAENYNPSNDLNSPVAINSIPLEKDMFLAAWTKTHYRPAVNRAIDSIVKNKNYSILLNVI